MRRLFFFGSLLLTSIAVLGSGQDSSYAGSQSCQSCHQKEYQLWQQSDHQQSMLAATAESVRGDFSNVNVEFHGIKTRFFKEGERYFIETQVADKALERFEAKYTFGFYPLQQYLIETNDGHIQAFNIAWDSREAAEGGQRWYHLQPDEKINPEHPFFWTRHFQNWNARCSDCHSTNVQRGYDEKTNSYDTQWSEVNVACEACHGAAAKHVDFAKNGQLSKVQTGFSFSPKPALSWRFDKGDPIANPVGEVNRDTINQCGGCHSLRTQLSQPDIGNDYHDTYAMQLFTEGSYFADGQIREEVFVLGSFMQSKMHEKGVTCNNCHNPHSGKLLVQGNALCSQCHNAQVFDTPKHHHHESTSEGAACVNCHMPERTYMQVDDRRDHSFTIPRPHLSQSIGIPNACSDCHQQANKEQGPVWASQQLQQWGVSKERHWSEVSYRAGLNDAAVTRPLTVLLNDPELPVLVKAGLLRQLSVMPSRVGAEAAQQQLASSDPLLRRAAIEALSGLPANVRWQLLSPHLNDSSGVVRFQLAETLADVLLQLPEKQRPALQPLINEYRQSLAFSAGSPASHVALAVLEGRLNNINAAERAYQQALRIEPNYIPALLNLADLYRSTGRDINVEPLFKKALTVAPDSAAVQHAYGLFLVRQQKHQRALWHLRQAIEQEGAQARYAYVYAIALDSRGNTPKAIAALIDANERWPNQYELLMTLVVYLDKTTGPEGDKTQLFRYLSILSSIAPGSPEVKKLIDKYR